ncbi:hypothetical protein HY844_00100 [Candidatus Berkelbacteria bacterium]|nr:hypothetical protein [Candidatus Berkelbacteria bacterium]
MLKTILENYSTTTLIIGGVLVLFLLIIGRKLLSFVVIGLVIAISVYFYLNR